MNNIHSRNGFNCELLLCLLISYRDHNAPPNEDVWVKWVNTDKKDTSKGNFVYTLKAHQSRIDNDGSYYESENYPSECQTPILVSPEILKSQCSGLKLTTLRSDPNLYYSFSNLGILNIGFPSFFLSSFTFL